jgi:DNA-binding winged helix-turn-helix (wHTH) protein
MERPTPTMLRIGAWCVNPKSGQISRNGETARVESRTMRLLLCLAAHAGEVVSIDDLLNRVWFDVIVTPDSVYQAVASLRRLLGDDPKQPTYIATVPRLGYRMVATVSPWTDRSVEDRSIEDQSIAQQSIAQTGSSRASDANIRPRRPRMRRPMLRRCPARASEPASRGPPARRFASRSSSSLRSRFTARSPTTITQPHPPLLRSHRNPSPCCHFST